MNSLRDVTNAQEKSSGRRALVIESHRAIYVEIPKAACSSIKLALGRAIGKSDAEIGTWLNEGLPYVDLLDPKYSEFIKFTFVRNPWDRLVSCYVSKFEEGLRSNREDYRILYIDPMKRALQTDEVNFENFLRYVTTIPDHLADPHWRSQHRFIADDSGQLLVTHIGRFENIAEDFQVVMNIIGLSAELPHHNRSDRSDYRDYYSEETRDLVAARYGLPIALLSYQF